MTAPAASPAPLLPISAAAARLGRSTSALRRAARKGKLPSVVRANGYRLFRPADLDAYRERCERHAAEQRVRIARNAARARWRRKASRPDPIDVIPAEPPGPTGRDPSPALLAYRAARIRAEAGEEPRYFAHAGECRGRGGYAAEGRETRTYHVWIGDARAEAEA